MDKKAIIPSEKIDRAILVLRNKRVMLDADLAVIFSTTTKRLNERVKRNIHRFPIDFFFQLTREEKEYDHQFKVVFEAIRQLIQLPPKDPKRPRIGYRRPNEKD
jgi:hypothetical protein